MTEAKPAEFAKGDKVTNQDGLQLVVVNQSSPGGAVQAETAPGVKPYRSTFYAADSLKKARTRATKPADNPPPAEGYTVILRPADGDGSTVEYFISEPDEDTATLRAIDNAEKAGMADLEVVTVTKAGS